MANSKGSTYEKQWRDANYRLNSRGIKKNYTKLTHQTHSNATGVAREQYQKDFSSYLRANNIDNGKVNNHITDENVARFLISQTMEMSLKSSLNYTSGFNSMIKGLIEKNVKVELNESTIKDIRRDFKEVKENIDKGARSFSNPNDVIKSLEEISRQSAVQAEIQLNLGFRISEAQELINSPDKYIHKDKVIGIIGKGNHLYNYKSISDELVKKIYEIEGQAVATSTYDRHIKMVDNTKSSHSFRYNYAVQLHKEGYSLKEISEQLNHHREEITEYYLEKA